MNILIFAAAAAQVGAGQANVDNAELALDEIVVTGESTYKTEVVQVGAFRNRSILDTPATIVVVPRDLLDAQAAIGLEDALRNVPGVTQETTSPTASNNFVSRGVQLNARTNYRLNGGLQIINLAPPPIENKQRVELLQGLSALYYGLATPSGIVNLVTKRAGDRPVTGVYVNGDAEGSYGGGVDIGRKFGPDEQFGARLNGYASHVETPIDDVNGYRYMASGAFDWQATDRLALKLDVEHYRRATDEPGGIALAAFRVLTTIPSPHNRYAPVDAPYRTWSTNLLGRADYALSSAWTARVEGGVAFYRRVRSRADFSFTDLVTGPTTGIGRISGNLSTDQEYRNEYVRGELAGKFDTFGIGHDLLLGVARNRQLQKTLSQRAYTPVAQNIFDPVAIDFDSLIFTTTSTLPRTENVDTGLYVLDIAKITDNLSVIGGVRRVIYDTEDRTGNFRMKVWTPTTSVVFKPTSRSSLYFSYIEGLESAGLAATGTTNEGSILPAVTSKQIELGARIEIAGALASAAYFHIDRGLSFQQANSDGTFTSVVDGRAIHEGVEASLRGNLTPHLSVALAGQHMRATQQIGQAAQNGNRVENTPRWSASLFAEYRPPVLPAFGVNGGIYYTGQRYADALNLYSLPGYTTFGLGTSYKLRLREDRTLTLRVNGDNLTNKRYWATGGTVFYVGLARQVRLSASMDF